MATKAKFDQEAAFKSIIGAGMVKPHEVEERETPQEPKKENAEVNVESGKAGESPDVKSNPATKAKREVKKRVTLMLYPSSYGALQKIAYVRRKSISNVLAEAIAEYVADKGDILDEYERIKPE